VEIAGLSWLLGTDVCVAALEAALSKSGGSETGNRRSAESDLGHVHRELKHTHVTFKILWDEYLGLHPDGYRHSCYCDLYRG